MKSGDSFRLLLLFLKSKNSLTSACISFLNENSETQKSENILIPATASPFVMTTQSDFLSPSLRNMRRNSAHWASRRLLCLLRQCSCPPPPTLQRTLWEAATHITAPRSHKTTPAMQQMNGRRHKNKSFARLASRQNRQIFAHNNNKPILAKTDPESANWQTKREARLPLGTRKGAKSLVQSRAARAYIEWVRFPVEIKARYK